MVFRGFPGKAAPSRERLRENLKAEREREWNQGERGTEPRAAWIPRKGIRWAAGEVRTAPGIEPRGCARDWLAFSESSLEGSEQRHDGNLQHKVRLAGVSG